jgi:hypothetical protein
MKDGVVLIESKKNRTANESALEWSVRTHAAHLTRILSHNTCYAGTGMIDRNHCRPKAVLQCDTCHSE